MTNSGRFLLFTTCGACRGMLTLLVAECGDFACRCSAALTLRNVKVARKLTNVEVEAVNFVQKMGT